MGRIAGSAATGAKAGGAIGQAIRGLGRQAPKSPKAMQAVRGGTSASKALQGEIKRRGWKTRKAPTYSQVSRSVRKTMGY